MAKSGAEDKTETAAESTVRSARGKDGKFSLEQVAPGEYVVHLAGNDVLEHLISAAARDADARLEKREGRWRAFLTVGIAAFGFLGFASFTSLRSDLDREIDNLKHEVTGRFEIQETKLIAELRGDVQTSVSRLRDDLARALVEEVSSRYEDRVRAAEDVVAKSAESLRKRLVNEISFLQFASLAQKLDEAPSSVNAEDLLLANNLLNDIGRDEEIVARDSFARAMTHYLSAHFALDNTQEVRSIEDVYGDIFLKTDYTRTLMLHHYGERVCGSAQPSQRERAKFGEYLQTALDAKRLGSAVPYVLCQEIRENEGVTEAGAKFIEDIRFYSEDEKGILGQNLLLHILAPVQKPEIARVRNYVWQALRFKPEVFTPILLETLQDYMPKNMEPGSLEELMKFLEGQLRAEMEMQQAPAEEKETQDAEEQEVEAVAQ